ncbi:MAG: GDYXXLXY domain-containing protein [Alphaproteobacteria bacterium]|nr:GDYXXLXY domain-containing protein [Alphaproteobacteria bacterium]
MTSTWRILLAGALMTALVAWMIAERMIVLAGGREIVVAVEPVDPRDLFRGDYVRLAYPFTRIDAAKVQGLSDRPPTDGDEPIYVVLRPEGGRYVLDHAALTPPTLTGDQVMLLGTWHGRSDPGAIFVRYGIEQYFVPQGHGRAIETATGEHRTDIVLAVTDEGTAAIKALRIDGKEVYREGLF